MGERESIEAAEIGRRRRLLLYAVAVIAVMGLLFTLQRWRADGLSLTTLLLLITTVTTGASPLLIRVTGSHDATLALALVPGVLILGVIAFVNAGLASPALLFVAGSPLLAVFVAGPRRGAVYSALSVVVIVALFGAQQAGHPFVPSPEPYLTRVRVFALLSVAALNFVLACLFERERQVAASAMLRSREDFPRLIEGSPDAEVVVRDGRIVYANEALASVVGVALSHRLGGAELTEIIHPDDRLAMAPLLGSILGGQAAAGSEMSFRRPDGERVTLTLQRVEDVDFGGERALLLVGRDIADQKRMEAQLRVADRMASVGSLAAGVAHEVNNPLTYVMTNIGFAIDIARDVAEGAALDELDEALQALDEALDGATRVQRIVRDLQSFSRERSPERRHIDVRDVLSSAVKIASHEVKLRARLTEDYEDDLPLVWGDEPQLAQLFLNLIVNAAQAIPVGGVDANEIHLRCRRAGPEDAPRVVIEIADTGCGIDEAVLDRIFDPFFTTKPVGEGTGLGLAIAHGLVTGMKGQLGLRNNADRGVTATVDLPGARPQVPPTGPLPQGAPTTSEPPASMPRSMPSSMPPSAPRRPRVLVVDDEPRVGQALRRMLEPDHDVEVVARGPEAIDRLATGDYEAVLCDLMMPEMSGMELYDHVVQLLPDETDRFVFMTGGAFSAEAQSFLVARRLERGCRALEKPFSRDDVLAALAPLVVWPNHPEVGTKPTIAGASGLR